MLSWRGNFIGGRFVRPARPRFFTSEDPGDLDHPVGQVGESASAVDLAVAAAAGAQKKWAAASLPVRRGLLRRFQKALKRRCGGLVELISRESGKPRWEAAREVGRMIARVDEIFEFAQRRVQPYEFSAGSGVQAQCRYRPQGVLAVLGPFNFPAHLAASQFLPGLLTGNAVVFKPSEKTPFVGQWVAEFMQEADAPAGVFNMVQGGGDVGRRLVQHAHVNAVLFTGSYAVGKKIQQVVLEQPAKCVALEMGGKNAVIVLADADLKLSAREAAVGAFSMAGQRCNATSRILVERKVAPLFIQYFLDVTDRMKTGYPLDPDVFMGPLVGPEALAAYQEVQRKALQEGYVALRAGGPAQVPGRRGYYVRPSVHLEKHPKIQAKSVYRTQEWFVPDAVILVTDSDEQAVRLNNEVPYGLVTSVFTKSRKRFEKMYARIDTGLVNWNRGTVFSSGRLPFGGTKASGNHRPAGMFAIDACVYPVAVLQDRRPAGERESVPGLTV
ncbi:MAG: aldehyde dehydrogenase family protein [Candidatus Omnitrophica bacterium]|nr:aldehyde dehydrogenase family protein [Candidatus Omnitrophota bacterium]